MSDLSDTMRDALLLHLDNALVPIAHSEVYSFNTIAALIARQFLVTVGGSDARPTHTQITERGRDKLARLLGEYADILTEERCEQLHDLAISNWRARRNSSAGGWRDRWTTPVVTNAEPSAAEE